MTTARQSRNASARGSAVRINTRRSAAMTTSPQLYLRRKTLSTHVCICVFVSFHVYIYLFFIHTVRSAMGTLLLFLQFSILANQVSNWGQNNTVHSTLIPTVNQKVKRRCVHLTTPTSRKQQNDNIMVSWFRHCCIFHFFSNGFPLCHEQTWFT